MGGLTCRHCGYFVRRETPKAPARPRWVHTNERPTPPPEREVGWCDYCQSDVPFCHDRLLYSIDVVELPEEVQPWSPSSTSP